MGLDRIELFGFLTGTYEGIILGFLSLDYR